MGRHGAGLLLLFGGCALAADVGVLQQPALDPKGASGTAHVGVGGGGMSTSDELLAIDLDTRVDVASGGSRWTAGASALGGVRVARAFLTGRVGLWRAIVSGTHEATVVPSFELGGYVPLEERYDPRQPAHGESSAGIVFGVRDDLDEANYVTVFVGYALFVMPGY